MSDIQLIQAALKKAARRRRYARALNGMWQGLFFGSLASLVLLGAYHLLPLPFWSVPAGILAPFAGMLVGAAAGGWHKPGLTEVARWVDGKQRLQERLSTALEVSASEEAGSWRELVVVDAAQHVKELDPRRMLPLGLPRITRWALLLLFMVAGLGFVPEYRSKTYLQKKADEKNIKEVGRQLANLTRQSLEKRLPAPETQSSMQSVAKLGDQMAKQTLTRSDALKDLASAAEKLKDQLKEVGKDPALKRMQQAARSSSGGDSQSAASLQKQIESLQKQLGTPVGSPDALDQIKKKLDQLQQTARGMDDKNGNVSEADKQKMSEALSALSRQVQDMGLQVPELQGAIDALAANNTEMFLKDLQAATTDLEKLRDMAKSMQQLQQQMEKLGKDLAEQLKNGQAEVAQQTLQKMISQLNTANLSSEQLQKLQQEVAKAIPPAGTYGKVAEHLKDAAKQMQASNKADAAKSLDAAAKELGKLMQDAADAQQLQSTLDALNEASMYIGTGQSWRTGRARPQFGEGGRPGSGVGTWAEEGAEWDGQTTAGWDNTGVERPDMEGRGHTDRPQDPGDNFTPTKVRGQFSQGGQMPSITLKGVSIKGQSKIDYEAAATAAQSDAQSALSQEKVPRAYQGTVKEYFDDLKK